MAQLVGQMCVKCRRRIGSELDGRFCLHCGPAVHMLQCTGVSPAPPDTNCPACGADTSLRLAPDFSGGPKEERGTPPAQPAAADRARLFVSGSG
jgi:hypothetical protein